MSSEWPTRRDLGAIGAAIAVVAFILGLLAMLVLLKTKARSRDRSLTDQDQEISRESSQLVGVAAAGSSRPKASTEPPFEDDFGDELISDLEQLSGMIQRHVESNYGLSERQHDS
jgi:hypothetical protein